MVIDARHRLATVRKLPYDAEIEFLESTGTQWIDTEVKLATTSSARVTLDFYHLGSSQRNIFGSNDSEGFNCYLQTQTTIGFYLCGRYVRQSVPLSVNERHSLDWSVASTGEGSVILDGITYTTSARTLKQSTVNFYLYAQVPLESRTSRLKIYNCQIYVSGVLVRDYIPVRFTNELGQSEGAMYDKVSGQLFRNQGSGEFVMGPDVIPYDAEVEYLESTGTQWVDTQVVANRTNFKALVCLSLTSLTTQALLASSKTESGLFKRSYVLYYDDGNNLLKMYSTFVNGTWDLNRCASVGQKTINTRYNVEITLTNGNVTLTDLDSGIFSTKLADTPPNVTLGLGTNNNPDGILVPSFAKFYSCKLYSSGTLVRDFIPVRIGTTGYMYDRANPKGGPLGNGLYPNSGTGEFILGKDVAYPKRKFEVTYRKPLVSITPPHYTTRDYIQDGLIAMWDGIENVGLETHDSNSTVWKDLTNNGYDLNLTSKASFNDNCLVSQSAKAVAVGTKYLPNYYTIEIMLQPTKSSPMMVFIPQKSSSVRIFAIYSNGSYADNMPFLVSSGKGIWLTNRKLGDICSCAATYSGNNPINYYANGLPTVQSGSDTWSPRSISGITISDANSYYYQGNIFSIRTYDHALTAKEIAHNYRIDKIRFNLP